MRRPPPKLCKSIPTAAPHTLTPSHICLHTRARSYTHFQHPYVCTNDIYVYAKHSRGHLGKSDIRRGIMSTVCHLIMSFSKVTLATHTYTYIYKHTHTFPSNCAWSIQIVHDRCHEMLTMQMWADCRPKFDRRKIHKRVKKVGLQQSRAALLNNKSSHPALHTLKSYQCALIGALRERARERERDLSWYKGNVLAG